MCSVSISACHVLRAVQAIAEQPDGPGMGIDYDQILAKRAASSDAVFAWHQDAAYVSPVARLLPSLCSQMTLSFVESARARLA